MLGRSAAEAKEQQAAKEAKRMMSRRFMVDQGARVVRRAAAMVERNAARHASQLFKAPDSATSEQR
jgi:hypothetical protein